MFMCLCIILALCSLVGATTISNVHQGPGSSWNQGPAPSPGFISKDIKSIINCTGQITVQQSGTLSVTQSARFSVGSGSVVNVGSNMIITGEYDFIIGNNARVTAADFTDVTLMGNVLLDDHAQFTLRTGSSIQFGIMSLDRANNPRMIFRSNRELHLYERATFINDGEMAVLGQGYFFMDSYSFMQIHEGASMTIGDQFEIYDYGSFSLTTGSTLVCMGSVYIDYGASLVVQDHCVVTGSLNVPRNTVVILDATVFNAVVTCWPLYNNSKKRKHNQ